MENIHVAPVDRLKGDTGTMKQFCTAGPVQADIYYCLSPLQRMDRDELFGLIEARKYFILHAPRQTGKTTCLLALVKELNKTGKYRAVYMNIESAQAVREDADAAMRIIAAEIASRAQTGLKDSYPDSICDEILARSPMRAMQTMFERWAAHSPLPLIIMIDEIDSLVGDSLISVLRQLRAGYESRPDGFPQSVVLCGLRDLKDYRIHGTKEIITGGSAFNIKAESLRLGDFTQIDVRNLYEQHTTETGQRFEDDVYPLVWELTRGQPWLVNALAYDACFRMAENRDRTRPITAAIIMEAKERLILRRETHLDQLADKLKEERVRRVVQPILAGEVVTTGAETSDDTQYVVDLGLIRRSSAGLEVANAIYKEVIPRELNFEIQTSFGSIQRTEWYVMPDGRLDIPKLIEAFQQFYRENAEIWLARFSYKEAGPQLLLQAFLQRIVNGGGRIDREYGLGRRRTDLLVIWNYPGGVQRAVIELKVLWKSMERTLKDGLAQTAEYLDRVGLAEGHLMIFDRSEAKTWDEKVFRSEEEIGGRKISVWGM